MTADNAELAFWVVVGARFLVPLLIPRFPLLGILAALVFDGLDQAILSQFADLPEGLYQSYDKALDIYYLTIAYLATFRNWNHLLAFKLGRFLYYYRLFGVVLFELLEQRPLLLLFPNVFEYFFILFELVRMRWNPTRLTRSHLVIGIAFLWIVVKLPQEYWIHVAQIDTTDFIRDELLNAPADAGWLDILGANVWIVPAALVVVAVIYLLARLVLRRLPPADHPLTFDFQPPVEDAAAADGHRPENTEPARFFSSTFMEKIVLVGFLGVTLAGLLPELRATELQFTIGVAVFVTITSLLSQWLARRGTQWSAVLVTFLVLSLVNLGLILAYDYLLPLTNGFLNLENTLFFTLMVTLIVTLFDRYHALFLRRFPGEG